MFRLYLALSDTTLDEALEELALGGGVETEAEHPAAGENCERLIDDLTLARSSAENSIRGGIKRVTINKGHALELHHFLSSLPNLLLLMFLLRIIEKK